MFIAKDVAEALGYVNTAQAVGKHCKHQITISIQDGISKGNPNQVLIPESDIYRLVMRSKLPDALRLSVGFLWDTLHEF